MELFEEIAMRIPTSKSQQFSPTGVSELNRIEGCGGIRFDIDFPASGSHMADGTLCIGLYPYKQ